MEDTFIALNMRAALRNGLEGSSEETSFHDESLQDDRDEIENSAFQIHPAGQIHILFIPLKLLLIIKVWSKEPTSYNLRD